MTEVPCLSPSIAHTLISRSPLHAWQQHRLLGGIAKEATASMTIGKTLEPLIMGASLSNFTIIDADDFRGKQAKLDRDAALAANRVPVLASKWSEVQTQAANMREAIIKAGFAFMGESQVTKLWTSNGVACKGILDHELPETILDLKCVDDASPDSVRRKMTNYGYHIQGVAYTEAKETLQPELKGRVKMIFLFVETEPPYAVNPVTMAGTMQELGARQWAKAVKIWGECLASNHWPGYQPTRVDALPWQLAAAEDTNPEVKE